MKRVWETERPFELRLAGVTIKGRADVILDYENRVASNLAIVDYKTSTKSVLTDHDLQLQIYVIAGRREGLSVDRAYVHDLRFPDAEPHRVRVSLPGLKRAEEVVVDAAEDIRQLWFQPHPGVRSRHYEVRTICKSAKD